MSKQGAERLVPYTGSYVFPGLKPGRPGGDLPEQEGLRAVGTEQRRQHQGSP